MAEKRTALGLELEEALREAVAHRKGDVALPTREINPMPAERVKAIRRAAAGSTREFERKFHIPARTIEGWEQGRRAPDPAARAYLTAIEREPDLIARAVATERG